MSDNGWDSATRGKETGHPVKVLCRCLNHWSGVGKACHRTERLVRWFQNIMVRIRHKAINM